jgi:hypothetical protein
VGVPAGNGKPVNARILAGNLSALGGIDPLLASRLNREKPNRELVFLNAGGLPVPARAGPRPRPYHSSVDPQQEGRRLAAQYSECGYLVALGLGGGYHLAPLLAHPALGRLLIVERDAALARAVLERIELRDLLGDRRVRLLLGPEPAEVAAALLAEYLPALHGGLQTMPLRAGVEEHKDYYRRVVAAIQQALGQAAGDYSVQVRFGKRWYLNTLANLERAERCSLDLAPVARAAVAGAGPSLEGQIEELQKLRPRPFLIAADTALPALLGRGLTPELVVSIDCQLSSYHHFLQGLPRRVPLVLDLASPPVLTRLANRILFFASAHPLAQYLSARFRPLPFLDTSGGNVAQAAVSVALALGARELFLLGLDFSYPEGKPYSRGTYLYPLFGSNASRLAPLEGSLLSFVYGRPGLYRERSRGSLRFGTSQLRGYKERLEALARTAAARFTSLPGRGVALELPERSPPAVTEGPRDGAPEGSRDGAAGDLLDGAPAFTDWRTFLQRYVRGLEGLAAPPEAAGRFLLELDPESRKLWATLLPAAASLREELPPAEREGRRVLERAREWSVATARRLLDR